MACLITIIDPIHRVGVAVLLCERHFMTGHRKKALSAQRCRAATAHEEATSVHPRCSEDLYYATSVHTIKLRDYNDGWGCAVVVNLTEGVGDSGSERQARRACYG